MVFRKESRAESFQRQISALRQQLSADEDADESPDAISSTPEPVAPPPAPMRVEPTIAARSAATADDSETGIISADSHWNGTLRSQGSLRVLGRAEGELVAADEIFVAEGAIIVARVAAQRIVVAGTIEGMVDCSGLLEILPTGRVSGDVSAPALVVHEGATVEGDLTMTGSSSRAS
jgi:cytoskeletal protein CcmA (bactofilin family)